MTDSVAIFTRAAQMLAEADTIQKINPPNAPGVYFIFYKTYCLYIGESKNIKKRLATHDLKYFFENTDVKINWFIDDNRKYTEKVFIDSLKPLLNGKNSYKSFEVFDEINGRPRDYAPLYFSKESSERKAKRNIIFIEYLMRMFSDKLSDFTPIFNKEEC